jgi:hypothetical protein
MWAIRKGFSEAGVVFALPIVGRVRVPRVNPKVCRRDLLFI